MRQREIYGSKDTRLSDELRDEWQDELSYLDDFFGLKAVRSQQILDDFIQGKSNFKELDFLYGYVYEMFCRKYGEEVLPDSESFDAEFLEVLTKEYSAFVPIPFSADFPHIVSIKNDLLQNFESKFLDHLKGDTKEDFASVMEKAKIRGKDLVFFNY